MRKTSTGERSHMKVSGDEDRVKSKVLTHTLYCFKGANCAFELVVWRIHDSHLTVLTGSSSNFISFVQASSSILKVKKAYVLLNKTFSVCLNL